MHQELEGFDGREVFDRSYSELIIRTASTETDASAQSVLSSMAEIFPTLRTLLLNRFARRGPCSTPRSMSVDDFNSIVKQKLETISDKKHSLSFVCFGPTLWARHYNDRSWSSDVDADILRWWSNGLGAMQKSDVQHDHRPVFRGTPWAGG